MILYLCYGQQARFAVFYRWLENALPFRKPARYMDRELENKLALLRTILQNMGQVMVAFSGGVDSSLLLAVASQTLGSASVVAVIAHSPIRPLREYEQAVALAESLSVRYVVLHTDELLNEDFVRNPPDRCYYCKKSLLETILELAHKEGGWNVVEGSNVDDASDYRPGTQALKELRIRSPLQEAYLTKSDIRTISRHLGLTTWNKPAQPCLATRLPYNETITAEQVSMVEEGEDFFHEQGFHRVRLRCHREIARIEVPSEDFERLLDPLVRARIVRRLKEIGFAYVALDLEGYRTGSMNELILSDAGRDTDIVDRES